MARRVFEETNAHLCDSNVIVIQEKHKVKLGRIWPDEFNIMKKMTFHSKNF